MTAAFRYLIQFLAGVGMFELLSRAYFLVWEYYLRSLPRPYQAEEFINTRQIISIIATFLICQLAAYVGMRAVLRPLK